LDVAVDSTLTKASAAHVVTAAQVRSEFVKHGAVSYSTFEHELQLSHTLWLDFVGACASNWPSLHTAKALHTLAEVSVAASDSYSLSESQIGCSTQTASLFALQSTDR
jgi:hypothetical protein